MRTDIIKAYRGVPVYVHICKDRYYDFNGYYTAQSSQTFDIALEAYEGLSVEAVEGADFNIFTLSGTLPDHTYLEETMYVLKPCGSFYLAADGEKYKGLLAQGLTDTGAAATYNLFYQDGNVVADVVESKDGWRWVGELEVPQHTPVLFGKMNFLETGPLTYENFYASDISGYRYMISDRDMPREVVGDMSFPPSLRIIARVMTGSNVSSNVVQSLFWDSTESNRGVGIKSSQWEIYRTTAVLGGSVSANTTYWLMFVQDVHDGSQIYYMVDDGTYTEDTLPEDVSQWTLACSVDGIVLDYRGVKLLIGNSYNSAKEYWKGKFDMAHLRVDHGYKIDDPSGVEFWLLAWEDHWRAIEMV